MRVVKIQVWGMEGLAWVNAQTQTLAKAGHVLVRQEERENGTDMETGRGREEGGLGGVWVTVVWVEGLGGVMEGWRGGWWMEAAVPSQPGMIMVTVAWWRGVGNLLVH